MIGFSSFCYRFCRVFIDFHLLDLHLLLSDSHFHLNPGQATEEVIALKLSFRKFTANQLLILSNIENFCPPARYFYIIICRSHLNQFLLMVVEVRLEDVPFITSDDSLNSRDLIFWVKCMAVSECIFSLSTILTINEGESKCIDTIPLDHFDSQVF